MPPIDKRPLGGIPPMPGHVENLSTDLRGLLAELEGLRRDVERADIRRRKETAWTLAVAAALILPILLLLVVAWQQLGISRDANTAAQEARRSADRVEDCTTPTGQCYQDGTKRTGGAVLNLARIQLAIASCQRLTTTEPALTTCITTRLKAMGVVLPSRTP